MYLGDILAPMFAAMKDNQATIKFHGSDQLWKICIYVREAILPHFKKVFHAILELSMDADEPVKTQASRINSILMVMIIVIDLL